MTRGLILDLETSGLDPIADHIIEIGLVLFECDDQFDHPQIIKTYGSLQEITAPLSTEITKITGLKDSDLKGQSIEWPMVQSMVEQADFIIAHNAGFDRSFLMNSKQSGLFESKHWACSAMHIDWRGHGFRTRALNYLACDHGFINPFAHRAIFDCATTFRVISPYLQELWQRSHEKEILISAISAPFEVKDQLKGRGYSWNRQERVWQKVVPESKLEEERIFLQESVYAGKAGHVETQV